MTRKNLLDLFYRTMVTASTVIPLDIKEALENCLTMEEPGSLSHMHLETSLANLELSEEENLLACPDTGYPLYYIRVGDNVEVEGGFSTIEKLTREAVALVTADNKLRKTMVHPLTRFNPGTNVLQFLPKVEMQFDSGIDYIEITAVPKGGGSEIFGTFYRMMIPMDAGKTCPPNIVGVCIGGTADLCMKLAKEACVLRPIGDRHPDGEIATMEDELLHDINAMGLGSMGFGGKCSALDVHIEYAASHTAALPVAFNSQCSICRRATVRVFNDNRIEWKSSPDWFGRNKDERNSVATG
jgi:tartrate/fumarate subfamily iron-sulfur-dependent hydro-lyase alpha chain